MHSRPSSSWLPRGPLRLFAELTGLDVDLVPAPPPGLQWDTRQLILGCRAQARRWRCDTREAHCGSCARIHLDRALAAPKLGHRFWGPCGMHMQLLPVVAGSGPTCVIALRGTPRGSRGDTRRHRKPRRAGGHFDRSVRLLRLLAETTTLRDDARSRAAEILRLRQALASHESEEAKLRRALGRRVRGVRRSVATYAGESHGHRAVEQLRERIQRGFAQPLVLTRLAEELGMNASHLSEVFSRDVGMPFKAYLSMVRLQRAQVLLHDPSRRVRDIANAVGYASADRFRAAFRAWAGLSPARWREVLRVADEV